MAGCAALAFKWKEQLAGLANRWGWARGGCLASRSGEELCHWRPGTSLSRGFWLLSPEGPWSVSGTPAVWCQRPFAFHLGDEHSCAFLGSVGHHTFALEVPPSNTGAVR